MKIATLLTQYLYTNHRLDLPGIGSFLLDPSALPSLENSKQRSAVLDGISFQSNPSIKNSPELIAYISSTTGKIKALATADLESHLELAQQFLNIGKPFHFEGIGTVTKDRKGEFEFFPDMLAAEKLKEISGSASSRQKEEGSKKYESFLSEPKPVRSWRMPVIGMLILAGLGLAIWGGYAISKKAKGKTEEPVTENVASSLINADTIKTAIDSANLPLTKPVLPPSYKYILEVAQSKRAFKRYNQLRTNMWEVKLETADSVQYKLVLLLPSMNADTTRVLDSLTAMTGKRVYIEHQN